MKDQYEALANDLLSFVDSIPAGQKHFVSIVGGPGSGKSTLAGRVCQLVNIKRPDTCVVVPMDGFHYYRAELDQMSNPVLAHARRGAPFTFNSQALLQLLQKIKNEGRARAPSFDHKVGDPVENDIEVTTRHKLVLVEGNYLLLEEDSWATIGALVDESWFIDCDVDIAMRRVRARHRQTGLTDEEALYRVENNDQPNALLVQSCLPRASRTIASIDDPTFTRWIFEMQNILADHDTRR